MSIKAILFANKKRRRLTVGTVVVTLILVGAYFLNHWANRPQATNLNLPTVVSDSSKISYQSLVTAYFSTKLPSNYRVQQTSNQSNKQQLNIVSFSPSNDEQAAFVSDVLPTGGLSEVGDYNLRVTDKTDYAPFHEASLPIGSIAFQSVSGGAMYSVFMTHAGRYTIVTVSDGVASDLLSLLNSIISNWSWL